MPKAKTRCIKQVFKHRQVFDEQIVLRNEAHNTFNFFSILVNVNAVDQHPAAGRFIRTVQDIEQRRLTRAAGPHQTD